MSVATIEVTELLTRFGRTVGTVLGLLYLSPIVLPVVTDPTVKRHLQQIAPSSAGLTVQATVDLHGLPIGRWAGLCVLAAWSAAAGALLHIRDA